MKKATTFLGIALLGTMLMSFAGTPDCKAQCENLQLGDITYIEIEEEIDLGFDTAQYLPVDFDPYQGMALDLSKIEFIETTEEIDLGFDTALYLPEGFNEYKGMTFDINEIEYVENEEEIILDFDVQAYLPINFNALSK